MDQDAFRQLLFSKSASTSSAPAPSATVVYPRPKNKTKAPETSSVATFKPRARQADKYRDRATERRGGVNDYADVEALLEDFEKQNAFQDPEIVHQQRQLLGGDSKHTVLVKGLDFALLEQQKAKLGGVGDDVLEEALQEAPRKRTREEIVAQLKKSRLEKAENSEISTEAQLEPVKLSDRFRRIGAPPPAETKTKKRKVKENDAVSERKKKKSKAVEEPEPEPKATYYIQPPEPSKPKENKPDSPRIPEDFDIFEDAGEYRGLDIDDDEEEGEEVEPTKKPNHEANVGEEKLHTNWFGEVIEAPKPTPVPIPIAPPTKPIEYEEEVPLKLQPLAGTGPSIKDILALDAAAEKEEKRKAIKEKKKDKKKPSEETKINREVKKLEKYTSEKSK